MLDHGGRLRQAENRYGIAPEDWLDLSTGINPDGFPVPTPPPRTWSRLPEDEDGLEAAARTYYGAPTLLPVAGSQAAIQVLPLLRAPGRTAVITPGYAEHVHAWQRSGHQVSRVAADNLDAFVARADVLVVIHPNNPTGARFAVEHLLDCHEQLAARGGWLVVDEAFMDTTPEYSLAPYSQRAGLVVLRSLGKFFGLAGARVGFVLAEARLLEALRSQLRPWDVAGPARWVATQALADRVWQEKARAQLIQHGNRLAALLARHNLAPSGGCSLFQWVRTEKAAILRERLARRGILVRLFEEPASLRFGLPAGESGWIRLDAALREAAGA